MSERERITALGRFRELVATEREAQDAKWGPARRFHDEKWLRILVEEVGECASAIEDGDGLGLEAEIVQVAAVCAVWLQSRWAGYAGGIVKVGEASRLPANATRGEQVKAAAPEGPSAADVEREVNPDPGELMREGAEMRRAGADPQAAYAHAFPAETDPVHYIVLGADREAARTLCGKTPEEISAWVVSANPATVTCAECRRRLPKHRGGQT